MMTFLSPKERVEAFEGIIYVWVSANFSGIYGLQNFPVFPHGFLAVDFGFQLHAHVTAGMLRFTQGFVQRL